MKRAFGKPFQPFLEFWSIVLNPTVKRGVIQLNPAFLQHFLQFPVANTILVLNRRPLGRTRQDALGTIPADGPQNNLAFELTTLEIVHVEFLGCYPYFNKNEF